ncbi:MAG: hypothetical protein JW909_02325 [Planctomycetes bacterium]|nr:hypothetical protein [Planctomycetota bacterium]
MSNEAPGGNGNLAISDIQYKTTDTGRGAWKVYVYQNGTSYREYKSRASAFGWPLVHMTFGRNPETGARKVAMGIIAIGRIAVGGVAIGQLALGILTLAQAGAGVLVLAQAGLGYAGIGQLIMAYQFAAGQVVVAQTAIGQIAVGKYALGQIAWGKHVISTKLQDPEAVEYFRGLWNRIISLVGW